MGYKGILIKKKIVLMEYTDVTTIRSGSYDYVIGKRSRYGMPDHLKQSGSELPDINSARYVNNKYLTILRTSYMTGTGNKERLTKVIANHYVKNNKKGDKTLLVPIKEYNKKRKEYVDIENCFILTKNKISNERIQIIIDLYNEDRSLIPGVEASSIYLSENQTAWNEAKKSTTALDSIYVPAKDGKSDYNIVFLTDYMEIGQTLATRYSNANIALETAFKNMVSLTANGETESHRGYEWVNLANVVNQLCNLKDAGKAKDHRECINYSEFQQSLKNLDDKMLDRQKRTIELAKQVCLWIDKHEFQFTLFHYEFQKNKKSTEKQRKTVEKEFGEEILQKITGSRFATTWIGRKYQDAVNKIKEYDRRNYKNKDMFENLHASFGERNWLLVSFFSPRKLTHGFNAMFELAATKIASFKDPLSYFDRIIDGRFANGTVSITTEKFQLSSYKDRYTNLDGWKKKWKDKFPECKFESKGDTTYALLPSQKKIKNQKRWKKFAESEDVAKRLARAIEVINIALALRRLKDIDDDDFWLEAFNATGAIVDSIDVFFKLSKRGTATVGVVSSVIDAISYGMDASSSFAVADNDAGIAWSAAVGGAGLSAIGSAINLAQIYMTGAASGIGTVVVIVGIAIQVIAIALAAYFTDSCYEQWLKHCFWGIDYGKSEKEIPEYFSSKYSAWVNNIILQLQEFDNVVNYYAVDFHYDNGWFIPQQFKRHLRMGLFRLMVFPRQVTQNTEIYISVDVKDDDNNLVFSLKNKEIFKSGKCITRMERLKNGKNRIKEIDIFIYDSNIRKFKKDLQILFSAEAALASEYVQDRLCVYLYRDDPIKRRREKINAIVDYYCEKIIGVPGLRKKMKNAPKDWNDYLDKDKEFTLNAKIQIYPRGIEGNKNLQNRLYHTKTIKNLEFNHNTNMDNLK